MPIKISESDIQDLVDLLLKYIGELWKRLTPEQQKELEGIYIALGQALNALRAGGLAGARGNLLAALEKLREFAAGLVRMGGSTALRMRLQQAMNLIQNFLRVLGGETAAGGTGAAAGAGGTSISIGSVTITGITTLTVGAFLIELIVIFAGLYLWYEYCEKEAGTAELPFGGKPCGNGKPVAQGLKEWDLSWGAVRSWTNLMTKVRATAATHPCPGNCATGKCTGVPAIIDYDQTSVVLGTYSTCRFDVYCECV